MAYILSKLLPLALLPLGFSLILLVVGLVGRWRWPVITAALLLWVFSLGLVSQCLWRWLEAPWQRRSALEAPQADAIVVLSGGRDFLPPGFPSRVAAAAAVAGDPALAAAFPSEAEAPGEESPIVDCACIRSPREVMRAALLGLGAPAAGLRLEENSTSTETNALEARGNLGRHSTLGAQRSLK